MNLTKKQEINLYCWCIHEGVNLDYGKLSLCDLSNFRYSHLKDDRRYQVHCEDTGYVWSAIYDDLNAAVNKFVEIKNKIKRVK